MHTTLDAPLIGATLFNCRAGGFPLLLCTYALLDADSNDTADLDRVRLPRRQALGSSSRGAVGLGYKGVSGNRASVAVSAFTARARRASPAIGFLMTPPARDAKPVKHGF